MIKKGVTLVELLVAMAIFLIIVTIVVGAFTSVSRMKALTSTMKESQQKTRIALEMITRLSRQAEKVVVSNNGKIVDLYFNIEETDATNILGSRFEISGSELLYGECSGSLTCAQNITDRKNLYEGITLNSANSSFEKTGTIPPTLNVILVGNIGDGSSTYFSDELTIDTTVILEAIK